MYSIATYKEDFGIWFKKESPSWKAHDNTHEKNEQGEQVPRRGLEA